MELSATYALPVVGGYAFSVIWSISVFDTSRESNHQLYFRSVFYGTFLCVVGALFHIILFDTEPYQQVLFVIENLLGNNHSNSIWSETAAQMILISPIATGPLLAGLLNIPLLMNENKTTELFENITTRWQYDPLVNAIGWLLIQKEKLGRRYVLWALKRSIGNNDFEVLLARAVNRDMPAIFTLDTGKVYVGWLVRLPNPVEHRKAVRILPLLSGYRDSTTHEPKFTHNYHSILSKINSDNAKDLELGHLEIDDFEVVLPYERIISSHLFDLEAYSTFQSEKNNHANP